MSVHCFTIADFLVCYMVMVHERGRTRHGILAWTQMSPALGPREHLQARHSIL